MEIQFTPWRMHYISKSGPKPEGCVLCAIPAVAPEDEAASLLLYRGEHCYVVMNLFPYNTAHLMVVPISHRSDFASLDGPIASELFHLTQWSVGIIAAEYRPSGFNIGMNLGKTAGAGIAEHLHMHIVPRWDGDSNFMPIVGGTKLIPETLEETYLRLKPLFK